MADNFFYTCSQTIVFFTIMAIAQHDKCALYKTVLQSELGGKNHLTCEKKECETSDSISQDSFIQALNEARGEFANKFQVANMRAFEMDIDLLTVALEVAKVCNQKLYDDAVDAAYYPAVLLPDGANHYVTTKNKDTTEIDVLLSDIQLAKTSSAIAKSGILGETSNNVEHQRFQFVSALTNKIGCARGTTATKSFFFICVTAPKINKATFFQPGKPCSACPEGTVCVAGTICADPNTESVTSSGPDVPWILVYIICALLGIFCIGCLVATWCLACRGVHHDRLNVDGQMVKSSGMEQLVLDDVEVIPDADEENNDKEEDE